MHTPNSNSHGHLHIGRYSLQTVDNDCAAACAAAKVAATATAVHTCEATIQITGGLGMTWDHTAHRLYKRAMALQSYLAGERRLYQDIADAILPRGAQYPRTIAPV